MMLSSPHARTIPAHELLAGLSRLHPFVFVAERDGDVSWMNDRLREHLNGDARASVPERDCLTRLCREHLDLDIQAANGTHRSVQASVFEQPTSDDARSSCIVVARPVPEERALLEELDPTAPLAQVLDYSPDGVLVADGAGFISYVNSRAMAFLGRDREELLGSPVAPFLAKSPDFAMLIERLGKPTDWDGVIFELHNDERRLWLSASTRSIERGGKVVGIVTYLQDVTDRHRMEAELKQKNHELESTIDSVAHDLRSPLVSLLGFARLLKDDYGKLLDEAGLRFLDRIEQAGRTMDALIHNLLELSRIREPGEARMPLDPRPVLQQLAAELKLRLDEHDVELEFPSTPPVLHVDATRLYQLFSNLIGNALVHGFGGDRGARPTGLVRVEILEHEHEHEIIVSDNGRGISEEDHDRIFEVFQTGRGVRRGDNSHGMGLAIVKKIARSHGGRVWVESAPERGAAFHIVFPHP